MWLYMTSTFLKLRAFILLHLAAALGQALLSCDEPPLPGYSWGNVKTACKTYAVLRANPSYLSLTNLSSFLGIDRADLAAANAFPGGVDRIFVNEELLVIPIECKCSSTGFFEAKVRKTTVRGDSINGIAEALEGLTSCKAIRDKNPSIALSPSLAGKINLWVPLRCACPLPIDSWKNFVLYPVKKGDTLAQLGLKFNVSEESIVAANKKHSKSSLNPDATLVPPKTLLIPVQGNPLLINTTSATPQEPHSGHPAASIHVKNTHQKKKPKMLMIGVYVGIGLAAILATAAITAAFYHTHQRRKRDMNNAMADSFKNQDLEVQQLNLSIRTTSDNKVSLEGSQYDDPVGDAATPHKIRIEFYTLEELQKATENFSSSNIIEGSMYHGRHNGKSLAIKRVKSETIGRIDYHVFQEKLHRHPNMVRLLGTCLTDGPDSYMVLEYAKNGSLKDWIHGGLAIKSQFIASCNCFLTWNQRLKICLDVATALQFMHHIMNPSYVHGNIRSRNIFLDEDFRAKVGNFGLSKCAGYVAEEEDDDLLQPACRDVGYLSPEYLKQGIIEASSDVFAYGVVLLEVISGRPPVAQEEENKEVKLWDEIRRILESEDGEELKGWMDSSVGEKYSFDAAVTVAKLARSCVEAEAWLRPTAGEIVEKMLRLVEELPEEEDHHFSIPAA